MDKQPVVHPSAWKVRDFDSKADITFTLDASDQEAGVMVLPRLTTPARFTCMRRID